MAPVNEPFSSPNSSLSSSVSVSAAQLIATKGFAARPLCRCSARATSSLPVPLSPSIRTGVSCGATRSIIRSSLRMAALSPTMPVSPAPSRSSSEAFSACRRSTSRTFSSAAAANVPTALKVSRWSDRFTASSAFVGGANIPVAYFSSPATVNNGRIDTWTICNPNGGKVPGYAINDFSGGYVSIMANNFRLGISGAAAGSGLPSIDALGVLTFTNGIVDANTLTVGLQQTTSGGAARGVINVGASATLKVNTLMTLAAVAGTANPD